MAGREALSSALGGGAHPYLCAGSTPWNGPEPPMGCGRDLRGAGRGAANVYFPLVMTSIYIPREQSTGVPDALLMLLERTTFWSSYIHAVSQSNPGLPFPAAEAQQLQQQNKALAAYPASTFRDACDEIVKRSTASRSGQVLQSAGADVLGTTSFRRQEFDVLMQPQESEFLIVKDSGITTHAPQVQALFTTVHLIERLTETRVLYGFNRVTSETSDSPQDRQKLLWRNRPSPDEAWLPASVVFGEGIFLELREDCVRDWQHSDEVEKRIRRMNNRYQQVQSGRHQAAATITPRLVLVHTLSHILINELAFSSGYSAASIRERLYVDDDPAHPMAGLLLYTADGDSEGTLGGLVRLGKAGSLDRIVKKALEEARWCSGDPVCMEIGGHGGQGPDSCNLAACHRCALIAETSCEHQNRFLDRATIVGDDADLLSVVGWVDACTS